MNKCLALLRNVYDDDHGFKITVTEQNGNIYSKYYRMIDYLKAYKSFEYASNHFILKGDHRIYHKDVKIEIVGTHVVPEFGTIAMIVLAVAIVSIIAVSAKSRLSIMPRI